MIHLLTEVHSGFVILRKEKKETGIVLFFFRRNYYIVRYYVSDLLDIRLLNDFKM